MQRKPARKSKPQSSRHPSRPDITQMPVGEVQRLVRELQSRQRELEAQNEELRLAQADLARSRDRFNELYDFAPVGYVTMDHRGTILEANQPFARMVGTERAGLIGRKFAGFVTAAAHNTLRQHHHAVFGGDKKQTCEIFLRGPGGTAFCAQVETVAIHDFTTGARHALSAILDRTEHKAAEEVLNASEAKYRKLHETMQDAFASVDMKGRILEFNRAFQELLGYTADELRTRTSNDLTPKEWHATEARILAEQVIPLGYSEVYEKEYRRKDGTIIPIELRTSLIRDSSGKPATMWAIVRDITARKETEAALARLRATLEKQVVERTAALRASEERYRQLIHGLPLPLCTCDADGWITLHNAAAAKLWGREPRPGKDRWGGAARLFTADGTFIPRSRRPMAMAVRHREPIRDVELIVERPDGTRSHVLAFHDPTCGADGTVTGVVNMMVDITALKTAENSLRLAGRKLRTLSHAIEQSPAGVLITGPSGTIEYVNPKFSELTGYALDELLGSNPRILKSGQHPRAYYTEMWETITAGNEWRHELCNRKKNGELFWSLAVIAPIHDERGAITHFVELIENITDRRNAEAALRGQKDRLHAVLNTVQDAIIIIDQRGIIVGVNVATGRIFGYAEAELLGRNVSMLMPSPHCEEHDGYLERYLRTGTARIVGTGRELEARRKNGTIFPIELAVSEVDHLKVFTGVIRDITRRKQLEAEVLRIAEEERMRVAADLHDGICQELAGIQFLANSLRREMGAKRHPLTSRAMRIEEAIKTAGDHTRQLARGMNPVIKDGSGLMHALRRLAATTARLRRIRCHFECPEPVSIESPLAANQIFQIAQEAIRNAIRHGRAKRITVRLKETGTEISLVVADNGCGLPPNASESRGMGLQVMNYRAGSIGAHLVVQPRKRGGTEVVCRIPKPFTNR